MKIKNILNEYNDINLFEVVDDDSEENPLDWKIRPRAEILIPDTEAHCIVRAKMIDSNKTVRDAFIDISLPERIVDFIIYKTQNGMEFKQIYELTDIEVIPAIASECLGNYELYYSKNNPDIGIEILRTGLKLSKRPSVIAEDLGYILRDEKRYNEALDAFLISEENGVSNDYIYYEIMDLYINLNNKNKAVEYKNKFNL